MQLTPEERERHAALSPVQLRFLDWAAANPEAFDPASYGTIAQVDPLLPYVPQPWPLFLESGAFAAMGQTALAVCSLVKQIPVRVFANDPLRLAAFYHLSLETAGLVSALIEKADCLDGAVGRGDFLGSADALKCCEFNMAGNLGGWQIATWAERYLALPVIRRFLAESGLRGTMPAPILEMFAHLADDARRHGLAPDGLVDTAIVVGRGYREEWEAYYGDHYRRVLAEEGLAGRFQVSPAEDLRVENRRLLAGGHPVQVVIDAQMGQLGTAPFVAQLAGTVRIWNGILTQMLSDKLNLALMSELVGSGTWSEAEEETIRRHVPWSRQVAAEFTDFEGERVYLPDLLAEQKERMVLKLGASMQGIDVFIGRSTPEARWSELIEKAVAESSWIAQERVETPTYVFLSPDGEAVPHEIVWGIFAVGTRFGGGYLRMIPDGRSRGGVINNAQGARGGPIVAVEPV